MPPAIITDSAEPPDLIVLLTGEAERPYLTQWLTAARPGLSVTAAESAEEISDLVSRAELPALISFLSPITVSKLTLLSLGGRAYSFHPGSPAYPGWNPSSFALYEGAPVFGATMHILTPTIAGGPVVDAEIFAIAPAWTLEKLDEQTYLAAIRLFRRLAPRLANIAEPPQPHPDLSWNGVIRSEADYQALEARLKTASGADLARLRRACGA